MNHDQPPVGTVTDRTTTGTYPRVHTRERRRYPDGSVYSRERPHSRAPFSGWRHIAGPVMTQ